MMRSAQTVWRHVRCNSNLSMPAAVAWPCASQQAVSQQPQGLKHDTEIVSMSNSSSWSIYQHARGQSALTGEPGWRDKIHLKGARFYGFHGALPEENTLGQPFEVDATVCCDLRPAGLSDDLNKTINYADVHRIIQEIMTGPPQQLIETVAEKICQHVLIQHPLVSAVQVHVRKLCIPAVPAVVQSVGVELARTREDYPNVR